MTGLLRYGWAILHLLAFALATDRVLQERDSSKLYFAVEIDKALIYDPSSEFRSHSAKWTYEHPLS